MNVDWLRELCLSFPGATEQIQWGNDLLFKVGGKMFAIAPLEPAPVWPTIFNNQPNDAIVPEISQLDSLIPSPSSQFFGYVHSPGTEDLGFSGPSVMDAGAVPNQVIFLLNTPYTNTVYYNLVNP